MVSIRSRFAELSYFARAIGLESVNIRLREWTNPKTGACEPPKPVFQRSFWIAFSRNSAHHIIPMAVLLGLIYVNLHNFYIGPGFSKNDQEDSVYLALFQIAAKLEEMLCVASLSTIVLQMLRHRLSEDGLPVGLLGSGISFAQLGFFISPDFLAAVPHGPNILRKQAFYIFLVIVGVIAALIGPASAVLLLPRVQTMPTATFKYCLNGTKEQFWPSRVDASTELAACSLANSTNYAVCPSGGQDSWRLTLDGFNYSNLEYSTHFSPLLHLDQRTIQGGTNTILVQSPSSILPPVIASVSLFGTASETFVIQPHGASAALQQGLIRDWIDATWDARSQYRWASEVIASTLTASAFARVRCSSAQNLSTTDSQASFPYLTEQNGHLYWARDTRMADISNLILEPSNTLRTQWTPLATEVFGITSLGVELMGLMLELPWTFNSRLVVACSISTSWYHGKIYSDTSAYYDAWRNEFPEPGAKGDPIRTIAHSEQVSLDSSWTRLLTTPSGEAVQISNNKTWFPNTLESLLYKKGYASIPGDLRNTVQSLFLNGTCQWAVMDLNDPLYSALTDTELWNDYTCGKGIKNSYLEYAIASLVADGLSRYASSRVYTETDLPLGEWTLQEIDIGHRELLQGKNTVVLPRNADFVIQSMQVKVTGYAYCASTTTDYLSIFLACLYLAIAGIYIAYTLYYRVTSSSWETITELLLLCQNSPPIKSLENTSAGVKYRETYAKTLRIRAIHQADKAAAKRLVLIAADEPSGLALMEKIEVDQAYS